MYHTILNKVNGNQKFLRCPDLSDKNFEVLHLYITLDEINLDCELTIEEKSNGNDSGFITYSNTINFASKWLDNGGYLITQCQQLVK